MNRITLLYKTFCNAGKELIDPSTFPYREVGPSRSKWWIGLSMNLFAKGYLGAEYINLENLPQNGPAIIAANHFSHLDGLLINGASAYRSRREVVFLAAEDLYQNSKMFRIMCNIVSCITVRTLHYKKPPRIILKLQSLNFITIPVYKSSENLEKYRSLRDNNLKQN